MGRPAPRRWSSAGSGSGGLLPVRPEQPAATAEGCHAAAPRGSLRRLVPFASPPRAICSAVQRWTRSRAPPDVHQRRDAALHRSPLLGLPPVGVPAAAAALGQLGPPGGRHGHMATREGYGQHKRLAKDTELAVMFTERDCQQSEIASPLESKSDPTSLKINS